MAVVPGRCTVASTLRTLLGWLRGEQKHCNMLSNTNRRKARSVRIRNVRRWPGNKPVVVNRIEPCFWIAGPLERRSRPEATTEFLRDIP